MRRKDREITDKSEIEAIIQNAQICRLAMLDGQRPYMVPLCYGYQDNTLYFHSANVGKKLDLLRSNNQVCFEIDMDCKVVRGENACKWGMQYKSIIGYGKAEFLEDPAAKRRALDIIMAQYAGPDSKFTYEDSEIKHTVVIQVRVESITGKKAG